MTKVSLLYPYSEGKGFDMKYYCEKHMPGEFFPLIPKQGLAISF